MKGQHPIEAIIAIPFILIFGMATLSVVSSVQQQYSEDYVKKSKYRTAQQQVSQLQARNNKLSDQNQQLKSNLSSLQKRNQNLENLVERLRSNNTELRDRIKLLKRQNQNTTIPIGKIGDYRVISGKDSLDLPAVLVIVAAFGATIHLSLMKLFGIKGWFTIRVEEEAVERVIRIFKKNS